MRKLLASLIVGLCTFEGMVQAGELRSGKAAISNSSLDSSSVTLQGNTFNAANKLVQLDAAAALPAGLKISTASLLSGQNWLPAQLPSTAAYTNTNNNFSGTQDFSGSINARAPLTVSVDSATVGGRLGVGIVGGNASYLTHFNDASLAFSLYSTGTANTGQNIGNVSYQVGQAANSWDLYGGPGHPICLSANGGSTTGLCIENNGNTTIDALQSIGSSNFLGPLTVNGSSITVLGANAGFGTGISTSTSGLNRVVTIASNNGGELVITDTSTGGQANINFNGADMGITTRHGAGKITFYTGNAVTQQLILPAASVTAGGALCINSSRVLTKCTSLVDASGNCTCP